MIEQVTSTETDLSRQATIDTVVQLIQTDKIVSMTNLQIQLSGDTTRYQDDALSINLAQMFIGLHHECPIRRIAGSIITESGRSFKFLSRDVIYTDQL